MLIIAWGVLLTAWGQTWLVHQVTSRLSRDLQSHISIQRVDIEFFNKLNLKGLLVEDQKQDTLLWAGTFQVHITDWFFFKDKADIKYVGLDNATIKLQRADSVWNYQFLEKYFASSGSATEKKPSGLQFNLQKVVMNNVAFLKKDEWAGQDMTMKVGGLDLDAHNISISNKLVDLTSLALNQPYFEIRNYIGKKPKDTTAITAVADTSVQANGDSWRIQASKVTITDGTFKNDQETLVSTVPYFDDQHIDFHNINATLKNINWENDSIRANISLSTQERSGITVQSLKADFLMAPKGMEFSNFFLQTNHSVIKNYFAMHYASIAGLDDFIHAVKLDADFDNASIASDDIAFFAPDLKSWKKNIQLHGRIKGTVDALNAKNLTIKAGNNTFVNGDLSIVGLPNIDETLINLKANDLHTTYADVVRFIPSLKTVSTPNLKALNYIHFKGTYTGFINNFVTYGTIQTALGTLITDLNMKFEGKKPPVYSGNIATKNFQLGKFINSPELGLFSFKGDLKGKSFQWNNLDVNMDGTVQKIQYNGYTYQNITTKGRLNNKKFDGDFEMKDSNADLHLTGLINLSDATPKFNVTADITHANLKALQLTKENLELSGNLNLNFSGSNLSNFLGDASIRNASLLQNGKRLSFDSLVLSSSYINNVRTLTIGSNELEATIKGNFDLESLPDAFTHFLHHYYPAYIHHPDHPIRPESFTFNITTGVIEDYMKLFDYQLSGFNNSHISGSLDMSNNAMAIQADVPQFSYNQYEFSDVQLKGDGNLSRLVLNGQVGNAVVSDSLSFPSTTFSIEAANDVSNITFNTTATQTINKANLSAQVKTFSDGATVLFNPSSFVLNGKTWSIDQGGELNFRRNSIVQGQLNLRESNQEIRISTHPSDIGNWNDIHVALQNINLGDFSPLLVKQNRIEGLLTGNITVEDPQRKFNITSYLKTDQLRIDNDSLGSVQASLSYNNSSGILKGSGNSMDPEHQVLFDLELALNDSTNQHLDRITVKPYSYPVKILERFLGDLFTDMQGYITGQLDILGKGANTDYIGHGRLTNAGLKVNFTQVFYKIDDTEIQLEKDKIDLGTIKLRDRFGHTATASGTIQHHSFQDMVYDIEVKTDAQPVELLNTGFNDNQTFYGRVRGTGTFTLKGPESAMIMYMNARPSDKDSSYITLPPSRSRESGQADFMVERKYGRVMTAQDLSGAPSNITYEVDLTSNPLVNIEVVLDELTGDVIKGRGTGDLHIKSGTTEPLSIVGRYNIEEGSYLFTFQSFFKKPFVLRKGGNNYIEWSGDPDKAQIHFDAMYRAEQVSFAPLASVLPNVTTTSSGTMSSTDLSRYRGDVNVVAALTGELFHPVFNFTLEFPGNNTIYNNPSFAVGIQQIEKDPNEINKQVTYLIVFNSFAPFENTQTSAFQPFNEFAYNTISGLVFSEVNRAFNQLLSKAFKNNNFTVNFTGSLYNRNLVSQNSAGFNINQSNLNVSVGRSFFNDRFVMTFGSTFDVPLQADNQQSIQFLPDVTAEWLINKSGTIRLTFFYRQDLDFFSVGGAASSAFRTKRSGASIAYRKEFESISEILSGRKKGKLKNQTSQAVNDSTKVKSTE